MAGLNNSIVDDEKSHIGEVDVQGRYITSEKTRKGSGCSGRPLIDLVQICPITRAGSRSRLAVALQNEIAELSAVGNLEVKGGAMTLQTT